MGKLGALHRLMNYRYLNGTHPAVLAMLRCNNAVQLPYRFPITEMAHCSTACPEPHWKEVVEGRIISEAHVSQAAQAGYACNYRNKRQPMAWYDAVSYTHLTLPTKRIV